jgi:hypothetical protein
MERFSGERVLEWTVGNNKGADYESGTEGCGDMLSGFGDGLAGIFFGVCDC